MLIIKTKVLHQKRMKKHKGHYFKEKRNEASVKGILLLKTFDEFIESPKQKDTYLTKILTEWLVKRSINSVLPLEIHGRIIMCCFTF